MTTVQITVRSGIKRPNVTRIRARLGRILKELSDPDGELSILFTGDDEMKRLNSTYRGKNKTTDVLSFPSAGGPGPAVLGDVIVSIPVAARQAEKAGQSMERETVFLLVHGILHLLGYDHELSEKEAKRMNAMQEKLMAAAYPG